MNRLDEQTVLDFARKMFSLYFEKRDMSSLSQYMHENISWVGTGKNELCTKINQAKNALNAELLECDSTFTVNEISINFVPFSSSSAVVYGILEVIPSIDTIAVENIRFSAIITQEIDGLKLIHIHFSHSDRELADGEYFVKQSTRAANENLSVELDFHKHQLEILHHNMPGGVHQCKNDPNLSIVSMSDSFLNMFGYSEEEIQEIFHNNFMEMIYPSDRAGLITAIYHQLQNSKDIEYEYRVMRKSKPPVWILDKGRLIDVGNNEENFVCVLIEIENIKHEQEALRLSLEQHQIILDQTTDIIFEWDIRKDTLKFSHNWYKKFGYDPISEKISGQIPLSHNIHPDDILSFVKIMKDTAAGVPYSEAEFRIRSINNQYYWCRIRATTQFDSDKRAIKAVGVIIDINNEKMQASKLLDMAQKDTLTGIYNKSTINSLVEQCIKDNNKSCLQALFILDVDNFKEVNDLYGHLAGDYVLSSIADTIKRNIRQSDLAGRIGGDEFLIYLPNISSEESAINKAEKLLEAISKISPDIGAPPISCSLGVSIMCQKEFDYKTFFKNADTALYNQKNNGRNGVSVFNCLNENEFDLNISEIRTIVDSDMLTILEESLYQYTFHMLYSAKDIKSTINQLLEIIGRSYDVSRVYIFENSKDGAYCSNTFEWCADGITPQIGNLQNISYLCDLGDYKKNFGEDGLFYCGDIKQTHPSLRKILEPQGISSMLQCAMMDEGNFVGYVGFDECRQNRKWSKKQLLSFKLTADVFSTFIVKMRLKQQMANNSQLDKTL